MTFGPSRAILSAGKDTDVRKHYLATPGPSPVPEQVRLALAEEMIHHRTADFRSYTASATANLKKVFKTENDVLIMAASGTGAMEAAVSNVISRGDRAITVEGGKFGERWTELVMAFGGEPLVMEVEWGRGPDPAEIGAILKANPDVKAVYATLCETSTATVQDIEAIGKIVAHTEAILVVDGISGAGAVDIRTDEWGVDILCVGSQKALMMPPGLAFVTVSDKAWGRIDKADRAAYYFDLKKARKNAAKNDTPYTPAVSMIRALARATDMIVKEGVEEVLSRHSKLARATRAAVEAIGLEIFSKAPADAVTAVLMPEGLDAEKLRKLMDERFGVSVAGGQAHLKGRVIRIAHMGYMGALDIVAVVAALEMALALMGFDFKAGSGLAACQKVLVDE